MATSNQPDNDEPAPTTFSWMGLALVVLSLLAAWRTGIDLFVVLTFGAGLWLMVKGEDHAP